MEMDVNIIPQFTGHVRDYLSVQVLIFWVS